MYKKFVIVKFKNTTVSAILFLILLFQCSDFFAQELHAEAWEAGSQREEVASAYWIDQDFKFEGDPTLALAGNGKAYANGWWKTSLPASPNSYYKFTSYYRHENIENEERSILARLLWKDSNDKLIGFVEYPATLAEKKEDWCQISQIYKCPEDAVYAELEMVYRWDADGSVHFGGTSFLEVTEPSARKVKLATIHLRPRRSESSMENLRQFAELIDSAGSLGADIVCLPEGVTVVGMRKKYLDVSEPIPGPSTEYLGKVAGRNNLYIVAGIYEKDGEAVYNTSVLLDREGRLASKYRKVCLPREEIEGGITPGNYFPTFQTDFGRIGMMICWDVEFPEAARTLRKNGAEVILMPIWGGIN